MTVLIGEFLVHPPQDVRSVKATSRMNCIHQLYQQSGQISNDDMLYTLSLLASFPIEWVARYEWRKLNDFEQCAMGTFWRSIGEDMGIDYSPLPSATLGWKDGLHWLEEIHIWSRGYRVRHMRADPNNRLVAVSAMEAVLGTTPPPLRPLVRWGVLAALDGPLRRSLRYVSLLIDSPHIANSTTKAPIAPITDMPHHPLSGGVTPVLSSLSLSAPPVLASSKAALNGSRPRRPISS
jgi:ER-bound oxygenase mpaB/B'/Rubber oxygenase, catalytic domain